MTFRKGLWASVISLGASLLLSVHAHASAISDATILHPTSGVATSSATALGHGKIKNASIDVLTGLFAGDAWSLLDRTNKPSKPLAGASFMLTADTAKRSGAWAVGWDSSELPAYMDYVLVLKSGKQWGAYLFESASLGGGSQDVGGTFGISWLNKKGKIAKLRHASIFGRIAEAPDVQPDEDHESTDGSSGSSGGSSGSGDDDGSSDDPDLDDLAPSADEGEIPTPGTLALLAMGLGLVFMQLRRQKC